MAKIFGKILMNGTIVGGGTYLFYKYIYDDYNKTAFTSWTTGYTHKGKTWDSNWDRRQPLAKKSMTTDANNNLVSQDSAVVAPTAIRHIFLIRHGEYFIKERSDSERKLTKLGRKQAEYAGKRLKELNYPYTSLLKSTMTRAQETASIIEDVLDITIPVTSCNLLEEGSPIPPDPPVGQWRPLKQFHDDGPRIEAAFRKHFHRAEVSQKKDSYEIVVCHANVIRYFICRALQFPPEGWLRMSIHHCSITWLKILPNGNVILHCLGDYGHIPPGQATRN